MKIGFTSTSFRQIRNLDKIVSIAVAAGVDCIECGGDIHVKDVKTAQYAKKICDEAAKYGIDKKDIIVDPLALTVSADTQNALVTLKSIDLF